MKTLKQCLNYVIILYLFCFPVLGDEATIPSASENVSSDNITSDETNKLSDEGSDVIRELEPSGDVVGSFNEKGGEDEAFTKQLFAEATSQNSGIANDITSGGQPVVVTLSDPATELHQRAALPPASQNTPPSPSNATHNQSTPETNATQTAVHLVKENLTEEIPSFSEWAQKHLEAEKNKEPSNASTNTPQANGKAKLRWKNYASLDCGAKVVASNPEAVSPSAILSPSRDEYKLNTCTSRIWFIVELCEAIQAKKIDFANFELFSSSPKDFVVSVSDRFPTREWSTVGQFTARDERDIQSFDLDPHLFGKYIKVEVKSHYGSEHYCPISLFRVYGTSEFEVLQKEDPVHADRLEDDDDDDDDDAGIDLNNDASKNLFSSATDAVISMVKKAAEVLGNKGNQSNQTLPINNITSPTIPTPQLCISPSHLVVCDNCTDTLYGQVYELLSCHYTKIHNLIKIPLIRNAIVMSNVCQRFGLDFCKQALDTPNSNLVKILFPERFLGAMCNTVATVLNKVVLNTTVNYDNNTQTITDADNLINIETSEPHVLPVETQKQPEGDLLTPILQTTDTVSKYTCSTDVQLTSQIKPTKTLTPDVNLSVTETVDNTLVVTSTEVNQSNVTEKAEVEVVEEGEIESVTESVEVLDENLDNFMEFNGKEGEQGGVPTTQTTPQAQKESVFLRLSNRIKALERNMSLSGQYLEELSKRYKKQVEEIQKLLDKTILGLAEESIKKDERNKRLEERLILLATNLEALLAEKRSWSPTVYTIIVSSLVTIFILTFCKLPEPRHLPPHTQTPPITLAAPSKKKRRPSDQALKIVRSSMETSDGQRKKKRKKHMIKRSNSISGLSEANKPGWNSAPPTAPIDWVEGKHIEEVPFVLEESEHSTLEPLVIEAPNFAKTALDTRLQRVNGDVQSNSASLDEAGRNGGFEFEPTPIKKEKKGFKRIFKKVF